MSAVSDDQIKMAMSGTAKIDFRALRFWNEPKPAFEYRGEGAAREIVPIIDEKTGKQRIDEEEMVEYETSCGGINNKTHARVSDLLAVNYAIDDPDDFASNGIKSRAAILLRQREQMMSGKQDATPEGHLSLEAWGQVSPTVIASLKFVRIYSVQQLAEASEALIQRVPSGLQPTLLRQQAITFLRQKAAAELPEALLAERAKTSKLEAQMAEMQAMLAKLLGTTGASGTTGDDDETPENTGSGDASGASGAPKRRGRAPMPRDAEGNIIREQEAA